MAELKDKIDITMSDRLSTQLQLELKIKELTEKLQKVEAELEKFKTIIEISSNPVSKVHTIAVSVNSKVKIVAITDELVEQYLDNSEPVAELVSDILDIVTHPYREVLANELVGPISAIVRNRMITVNGSAL